MTAAMIARRSAMAALVIATALASPGSSRAEPASSAAADADAPHGSLPAMTPLGRGRMGMNISSGVAVLLPLYAVEFGVGVAANVDVLARYETVIGLLHYPQLGVRWSPGRLGRWRVGVRAAITYRSFGIQTDHLNLTSTLYLTGGVGLSRRVSRRVELVVGASGEFDVMRFDVMDGDGELRGTFRYGGTNLRVGMVTRLAQALQWYLVGRFHIPTETIQFEAQQFYVIPVIELGGTWTW